MKEEGSDEGFVCEDYCFFLLAPVSASKSLKDVQTGGSAGDYGGNMC